MIPRLLMLCNPRATARGQGETQLRGEWALGRAIVAHGSEEHAGKAYRSAAILAEAGSVHARYSAPAHP